MLTKNDTNPITYVRIPVPLKLQAIALATADGDDLSDFIRDAVRERVEKLQPQPAPKAQKGTAK